MLIKNAILKISYTSFIICIFFCDNGYSQSDDLVATDNQADYLIISTAEFLNNLDLLISLRESQGLITRSVNIDTLYNHFQDTLSKPDAIKSFVSYTLEYWSDPKPQYLLLVGDVEFIPTYKVPSRFIDYEHPEDSIAIDDQFAINLYDDDQYPDIAIGRLPVSSNQQLESIIAKIIQFETILKREDYPTDYLGLADFRENEYVFEQIQAELTENILPDYYTYQRVDRRSESGYHGTKSDILNVLEQGCLFLSYSGHGSPFMWADSSFFLVDDIEGLVPNGLPFIFTAIACTQSFGIPASVTITEALIRKKDAGTVISFAPAGLAYAYQGGQLIQSFYQKLFEHPDQSIGNIIMEVKHERAIGLEPDDIILRYTLLGDPALKLPPDIIANIPEPNPDILTGFELYQNFPNPFNAKTVIRYTLPVTGKVELSVYNNLGQKVATLVDDVKSAGFYSVEWNADKVSSGIYFYRFEADGYSSVKKMIVIK